MVKLPYVIAIISVFFLVMYMALWRPLRKALFSLREGLYFSWGDFILFFVISLLLLCAMSVILWRHYRNECTRLYICNFGAQTEHYNFDKDYREYQFVDGAQNSHSKPFAEDYVANFPMLSRWFKRSGDGAGRFHLFAKDGAADAAKTIASSNSAKVFYAPKNPEMSQMVVAGCMKEYQWYNRAAN
ncbi:MAG: hypothetical protein MK052_00185 [Alphaproteobacteria bacterium]|nr:hypothetical protein [Alphaproteobacteria bacterium]